MNELSSRHYRYRLFAGVFLVVFLVVIIAGFLATRVPPTILLVASLLLVLLWSTVLIRRCIDHRRGGSKRGIIGVLSNDELRAARSKLKSIN
jgi:cobalamin biosynthesis protein CobD/CbiB